MHFAGQQLQPQCGFAGLLQGVIEQVTGRSFDEYLRSAIFGPAGMTSTLRS